MKPGTSARLDLEENSTDGPKQPDPVTCEVCRFTLPAKAGGGIRCHLTGCVSCGRMFGPCCNSVALDLCAECWDPS